MNILKSPELCTIKKWILCKLYFNKHNTICLLSGHRHDLGPPMGYKRISGEDVKHRMGATTPGVCEGSTTAAIATYSWSIRGYRVPARESSPGLMYL